MFEEMHDVTTHFMPISVCQIDTAVGCMGYYNVHNYYPIAVYIEAIPYASLLYTSIPKLQPEGTANRYDVIPTTIVSWVNPLSWIRMPGPSQ